MAASVTVTAVQRHPDGRIGIVLSDGSGLEFNSVDQLRQAISELDNGQAGQDNALRFLIGRWLAQDSTASGTWIVNKTLTLDLNNVNPLKIQ